MADETNNTQETWNIFLYLAGDSNLSEQLLTALQALSTVAKHPNINIAAHLNFPSRDRPGLRIALDGSSPITSPNLVSRQDPTNEKDEINRVFKLKAGWRNGKRTLSHARRGNVHPLDSLPDFIKWAKDKYPNGKDILILAGHGPIVAEHSFLWEDNPRGYVSLASLSEILSAQFGNGSENEKNGSKNKKLAVLLFDSCMAGCVEVAYEMRKCAEYMITSQGLVPSAGRPFYKYQQALGKLIDDKTATPIAVAQEMCKVSFAHHTDFILSGRSFDIACCDLAEEKVESLANWLSAGVPKGKPGLVAALRQGLTDPTTKEIVTDMLVAAHWKSQSYWKELYTDLYDFCEILGQKCKQQVNICTGSTEGKTVGNITAIKEACAGIMEAIAAIVLLGTDYIGPDYQYSHGLSIFFPWSDPSHVIDDDAGHGDKFPPFWRDYEKIALNSDRNTKKASWLMFLRELYLTGTEREVRKRGDETADYFNVQPAEIQEIIQARLDSLEKGGGSSSKGGGSSGDSDCYCPSLKNHAKKRKTKEKVEGFSQLSSRYSWEPSQSFIDKFK